MFAVLAKWLHSGLRGEQHHSCSRLSKDQAIRIAQAGAAGYPNSGDVQLVAQEPTDRDRLWILSSATVGRTLQVSVDDSTGEVVEIKEFGIR